MLDLRRMISTGAVLTLGLFSLFAGNAAFAACTHDAAQSPQELTVSPQQLAAMSIEDLRAQLAPNGWRVERDASGDLLLYPGTASSKPASTRTMIASSETVSQGSAKTDAEQTADNSKVEFFRNQTALFSGENYSIAGLYQQRDALRRHGWDVKTNEAGDILLFPKA